MDIFSGSNCLMCIVSMVISLLRRCVAPVLGSALFLFLFNSCEKPEGPGGKGTIKGQVMMRAYDRQFRVLQSVRPAADEDVYIQYGGGETVSDDRTTSPEGRFEFKYLSKGDYTVFVYSEDSTLSSGHVPVPVERSISLTSNNQVYDMGQIFIYESLDIDDGHATIAGRVMQVNYSIDFIYIIDTTCAQELDVYLVYEDDLHYSERVQTLYDGSFAFPDLIKGNYSVFVYGDDIEGGTEKVAVMKNVTVDAMNGLYDAGILYRPRED